MALSRKNPAAHSKTAQPKRKAHLIYVRYAIGLLAAFVSWPFGVTSGMLRTGTAGRMRFIRRCIHSRSLLERFIAKNSSLLDGTRPYPGFSYQSTITLVPQPDEPGKAILYNMLVLTDTEKKAVYRKFVFFLCLAAVSFLTHWALFVVGSLAYIWGCVREVRFHIYAERTTHVEEMGTVELLAIILTLRKWMKEKPDEATRLLTDLKWHTLRDVLLEMNQAGT